MTLPRLVKTKSFHPLVLLFAYATVKRESMECIFHMVCLSVSACSFSETMEFAVIKKFQKSIFVSIILCQFYSEMFVVNAFVYALRGFLASVLPAEQSINEAVPFI
jgi:hypothetical protein